MIAKKISDYKLEAINLLKPENKVEKSFFEDEDFLAGLWWGKPRYGHPEGEIVYHIAEVLKNIDQLNLSAKERQVLRYVAFVHDTFKNKEHERRKVKDYKGTHSFFARQFLSKYIDDTFTLDLVEWHDEAYFCWRMMFVYDKKEEGEKRFERFLDFFKGNIQTYFTFFKCDTQTGDKNQEPLFWFTEKLKNKIEC